MNGTSSNTIKIRVDFVLFFQKFQVHNKIDPTISQSSVNQKPSVKYRAFISASLQTCHIFFPVK